MYQHVLSCMRDIGSRSNWVNGMFFWQYPFPSYRFNISRYRITSSANVLTKQPISINFPFKTFSLSPNSTFGTPSLLTHLSLESPVSDPGQLYREREREKHLNNHPPCLPPMMFPPPALPRTLRPANDTSLPQSGPMAPSVAKFVSDQATSPQRTSSSTATVPRLHGKIAAEVGFPERKL